MSERPDDGLRSHLLAAAEADGPPERSRQRALDLVDALPAVENEVPSVRAPAPRGRWAAWMLAAAAAFFGVATFGLVTRRSGDRQLILSEPPVWRSHDRAPTPQGSQVSPAPHPAAPQPDPVAERPTPVQPRTGPAPSPAPGPMPGPKPQTGGSGACGCKGDDLMCNMRCSQKKKKR
jgi:hypothetical protein